MKIDIDKKYIKFSIYVALAASIVMIIASIMSNVTGIFSYIKNVIITFLTVLTPLNIALVLAYIINKPMESLERLYAKITIKGKKIGQKSNRIISLITIYLSIIIFLIVTANFVFPQIKDNVGELLNKMPGYARMAENYAKQISNKTKFLGSISKNFDMKNIAKYATKFSDLSKTAFNMILNNITDLTLSIFNIFLAFIISFYLLKDKEKFKSGLKVFRDLYLTEKLKYKLNIIIKEIDSVLGQFMLGLIIESLITAVLITTALLIVKFDYAIIIGLACCILNVIPYFGAFILMALTFLLGLLDGPNMAITALICVIIVHEVDSNFIQPKIIGSKVGVEPIWVMVGITVGGSYFGILGMILAVPAVALIKTLISYRIKERREKIESMYENKNGA